LARVFRELGYIEHWGSGLQRIKQMCEAENLTTPEFLETNDFFDVKLYRPVIELVSDTVGGTVSGTIEGLGGIVSGTIESHTLTERQIQILELIQKQPKISYRQMIEELGINKSAIQKHLESLKNAGWLERIGGTRGYWAIKKEFGGEG
jgi:ATP-dependent DNA helicase RecG